MRFNPTLPTLLVSVAWFSVASAQSTTSAVYSNAIPPAKESLERLNLHSEWNVYVPLDGRADGLAEVQIVDAGQIFAQTRAGLLVAVDAITGAKQWTYRYPRPYSNVYPVGVTDRFVFAVNVSHIFCFHRYTGLLEFQFELPGAASAGPVADHENFYVTIGATKAMCYRYPQPIQTDPVVAKNLDEMTGPIGMDGRAVKGGNKAPNAADQIAKRYAERLLPNPFAEPQFEATRFPPSEHSFHGDEFGGGGNLTPSISALPRVSPPYTAHYYSVTPSISTLHSLRRPYQYRPDFLRYNQRTPSISTIPPSVARVAELANLRPRPVEPIPVWTLHTSRRVTFQPMLTNPIGSLERPQVWYTTADKMIYSVYKKDRTVQVVVRTTGVPVAPGAGPVAYGKDQLLGYFALDDGTLLAVDLTAGNVETPAIHFRSHVGGRLNHKAVPTRFGAVYASGENIGIAKVDDKTGDVIWRTDPSADRLLAVNEEFAYILNDRNELLVYDAHKVNDPVTLRANPLAKLPLDGFDVPIANDQTDRVLLAAHNGLISCLRSRSPKYAKPLIVAPPTQHKLAPAKPADEAAPAAGL
ncbi:MAG: hypothetical protein LC104_06965 [Bacteroidales bacterium]|nr:hypothetical protein [Bacteroidales bacterium]